MTDSLTDQLATGLSRQSADDLPVHMRRVGMDPAPELAAAREQDGVVQVMTPFGTSAWLITRYADIRMVLGDAERFSNASLMRIGARSRGEDEEAADAAGAGNLLGYDPPEHTRLRRMLTPEFTMRRMRHLEPRIEQIVTDHLDEMERAGSPAELVADFALPIPSLVICELLGVPWEDRADFQRRSGLQLDTSVPIEQRTALRVESQAYMHGLVERARSEPGEDMIGMLVREHGDDLTTAELVGIAGLLLLAGHETTSNMLGLGTLALLQHPDQLAMVRDDPDRVDPAIEELLRWLSIVPSGAPKMTTTDVEIAGTAIPAGSVVVVGLPSANRDPEMVEDPDRLDITRGTMNHLGFGHGVHHCLGAPLARMEMRIAFPALLRRFPTLRLDTSPDQVEFRSHHLVWGIKALPVAW